MKPITVVDAAFALVETPERPSHVSGLCIFDLPEKDSKQCLDHIIDVLSNANDVQFPLDHCIVQPPGQMPYLEKDIAFDLSFHFHRFRLPKPGNSEQLASLVERLHTHILDRSKPPWEVYFIEELENNQFAMFFKVHHTFVDGITFVN
jgi:hypothetical protein